MPREQVEWYMEQSLHDDDRIHARQCCTYYSIVNANQTNYPYSSSFEQQQTWTITRTMSNNNHKRYQSSIENIHLTIPCVLNVTTPYSLNTNHEIDKIKIDRSISLLPPLPPTRHHVLSSHRLNSTNTDSKIYQQQTLTSNNSSSKTKSIIKKSQSVTNPMRFMHVNGEYIVRI